MIEHVEVEEELDNLVAIKITNTLSRKDYDALVPEMCTKIRQCGKINIYLEIRDGAHIDENSFWPDIHFNLKHAQDIKKVAFVGDEEHEEQILEILKPLENAEIRWYNCVDKQEALDWLRG